MASFSDLQCHTRDQSCCLSGVVFKKLHDQVLCGICNSCNMRMRALPDMLPEGRVHTYQAKSEFPLLQLICNTYQADSLYRAINHPI